MTTGHKHREVRVKVGGLLHRALTAPLLWSRDLDRVDASPYPWGPYSQSRFRAGDTDQPFYLSALSVLHRWTGLTLRYPDDEVNETASELTQELLDQLTVAFIQKLHHLGPLGLETTVQQTIVDAWLCATNPAVLAAFLDPDVRRCRECGCTDVTACSPPCSWVEPDLCSACA